MAQVPLFWKLAVEDAGELRGLMDPGLEPISDLHVTLLYVGGKSPAKAAILNDLSVDDFQRTQEALQSMLGTEVDFNVTAVFTHADMIVAEVALPATVPCAKPKPHMTLCRSQGVAPVFAATILESPSICTVSNFSPALRLRGVVGLETALAGPGQVRERREADEAQGPWVHVKKHSSMGCAVVTFPSASICDVVLARCASGVELQGNALQVKPHQQKQSDGTRVPVPECAFVGWKQPKRATPAQTQVCADDLLDLFEGFCSH